MLYQSLIHTVKLIDTLFIFLMDILRCSGMFSEVRGYGGTKVRE